MIEIMRPSIPKQFTLVQAEELLPLIYRLTEEASKEVKYLMACVDALPNKSCEKSIELQDRINSIVNRWNNKLERLGAKPKGLWLADFDNGHGYFCWKFPETKILFHHGYQDGFSGRILITTEEESDRENSHSSN